jgi:hypothetical protein
MPVPAATQAALDRAKWEQANYHRPGMVGKSMGWVKGGPDVSHGARSGNPTMTDPKKTLPASIPVVTNEETASATPTPGGGTTDVSATPVTGSSALDTKTDARSAERTGEPLAPQTSTATPQAPLPTNRDKELQQMRKRQAKAQERLNKKKKKTGQEASQQTPATNQTPAPPASAAAPQTTTPPQK